MSLFDKIFNDGKDKKPEAKGDKLNKLEASVMAKTNGEDADLTYRWWENQVIHEGDLPEFEGVDTDHLFASLYDDIKNGRMEIIEIPENVTRVMQSLDTENWNYNEIVKYIESSPGITGDFLATANSAAFTRGEKITDLAHALPRLGKETMKAILFINTSKMSVPDHKLFQMAGRDIVEHSMAVAKIASYLSTRFNLDPNHAFLAGLLHDIGKLALLKQISIHCDIPEDIGIPYHQSLFDSIVKDVHESAGNMIAEHWELEEDVRVGIANHHHLQALSGNHKKYLHLAALINLSDTMARMLGKGMPIKKTDLFKTKAARVVGLQPKDEYFRFIRKIPDII